ncbi:MAG TPA: preprotein translocase subunit SecE [Acidimicrobiia bacterium]
MTGQSPRDIDWPTRRWLLWGLLAVLVVTAITLFFVFLGNAENEQTDNEAAPPEGAEQLVWSITLVDMTGDEVTLKGDLPLGMPTETWQNDFQVTRTVGGAFEWDVEQELPATVVEIDQAAGDCEALNAILAGLVSEGDQALEAELWHLRAFAQHTINTMRDQGCTIDDAALQGL